jgi:hypothetical protein
MLKSEPVTFGIKVKIAATETIATVKWSKGYPPNTFKFPAGTTKEQAIKQILDYLHSSARAAAAINNS